MVPPGFAEYPLNSQGYAEDQFLQFAGGSNTLSATYEGDNSYNSSTAPQVPITVTKAPTSLGPGTLCLPSSMPAGDTANCTVTVTTSSYGIAPTGTLQVLANGSPIGSAISVTGKAGQPTTSYASATALVPVTLQVGTWSVSFQYSGDEFYVGPTISAGVTVNATDINVSASPSTISILAPGQSGSSTITISSVNGFTGAATLYFSGCPPAATCTFSPDLVNLTSSSPATSTFSITTTGLNSVSPLAIRRELPPSGSMPVEWPWVLPLLLALGVLLCQTTTRRRNAAWLFTASILMVLLLVACGGGGGGGFSSPSPAPAVIISPSSLLFSTQATGTISAAQSLSLSNTGSASLNIASFSFSGTNGGDFSQTNTCGSTVAAQASCAISVTFTPSAAGVRTGNLVITDNASTSPQNVSLSGSGVVVTAAGTYPVEVIAEASPGGVQHIATINVVVQ